MKITLMHAAIGEFSFPLQKSARTVIGRRGVDLDLELTWDTRISRRHATVWVEDGAVWYEDLESRNGSWQGTDKLAGPVRVGPGDSILIGETVLSVPGVAEQGALPPEVEVTHNEFEEEVVEQLTAVMDLHQITADLRYARLPGGSLAAQRRARRIIDGKMIKISLAGPDALRELWLRDISKGGLFVETDSAPDPGSRLVVHLDTPGGRIDLNATVVHVVDLARGTKLGIPPGAGLEFTDLNVDKRAAIRNYIDGIAKALDVVKPVAPPPALDASVDGVPAVIDAVKRVLAGAETDSFYAALDLIPTSSTAMIAERIAELFEQFEATAACLAPPQAARVRAAMAALARIRRVLGSVQSRLEFDFRAEFVRARERIASAETGAGPTLGTLRRTWNKIYPDRVDQAALLTRQAFAARQTSDVAGAIRLAQRALELNPFFEEMRKKIADWEQYVRDQASDDTALTGLRRSLVGRNGSQHLGL